MLFYTYSLNLVGQGRQIHDETNNRCSIFTVFNMMCDVQALAAASKTVDFLTVVHGLHAYFLVGGDFDGKNISMSLW